VFGLGFNQICYIKLVWFESELIVYVWIHSRKKLFLSVYVRYELFLCVCMCMSTNLRIDFVTVEARNISFKDKLILGLITCD
jgi:hypothetical protein